MSTFKITNPRGTAYCPVYTVPNSFEDGKIKDLNNQFKKYNVLIVPISIDQVDEALLYKKDGISVRGFFTEETILMGDDGVRIPEKDLMNFKYHLKQVIQTSTLKLQYYSRLTEKVIHQEYTNSVKGIINLDKIRYDRDNVYGWNDIFVSSSLGINLSYQELEDMRVKITARAGCVSQVIKDHLHYKEMRSYKFQKDIRNRRPIEFERNMFEYIQTLDVYTNNYMKDMKLINAAQYAINQGVTFRQAINNPQSNLWCPGLNTNIPTIVKDDRTQELIYSLHDIYHHIIHDLLFDGNFSALNNQVYMIFRLLSEALSLTLADMFGVHAYLNSGGIYETVEKRKIYPVLKAIMKNRAEPVNIYLIREVMKGTVEACFFGDGKRWLNMISDKEDHYTVSDFITKYKDFFSGDFTWSKINLDNSMQDPDLYRRWWKDASTIREYGCGIKSNSVSEFVEKYSLRPNKNLLDEVFDIMFDDYITPAMRFVPNQLSDLSSRKNVILRWFMGQIMIFHKFNFLPESKTYRELIMSGLKNFLVISDLEQLLSFTHNLRVLYEQYLDLLVSKNLITEDDKITYQDVYPYYPPNYIVLYNKTVLTAEQQWKIIRELLDYNSYVQNLSQQIS